MTNGIHSTPYWPWCPMAGVARSTALAVDIVNYGDGYVQRVTRGLNPARPSWSLTFPFTTMAELQAFDAFLVANSAAGFWMTPPDAVDDVFVTADAWAATITDKNLATGIVGTLAATFVQNFNPQPITRMGPTPPDPVASVTKALAYLKLQALTRTVYSASVLTPDDLSQDRHALGEWNGTWTAPTDPHAALPYTPVLMTGPLWFPIGAGKRVDFAGRVDVPFYTMQGFAGRRQELNPTPPPDVIDDPSSFFADGGVNWGAYYVVGSVGAATQFIAPIAANAAWQATVAIAPVGKWSFQIITYANAGDADADSNRILVGHSWLEAERPGDVRSYYALGYATSAPQFTGVVLGNDGTGGSLISGTLHSFTAKPGFTYQILVTNETDVEYCWALAPVSAAGPFSIDRGLPFDGKIKLRLVEQANGCSVAVVGQVWAQENAADAGAYPDLRIEYRAITAGIPAAPDFIQPAQLDRTWQADLTGGGAVGRVSLVHVNSKRIIGEYTMPTGLMRSFIVPPDEAGQDTTSVYYDGFLDSCFLYDQAVALVALLQMGERAAAVQMVDALLTVQNPDGSFPFSVTQAELYTHDADFTRTGAVAWVCYALLLCASDDFVGWFPNWPGGAAQSCLNYVLTFLNSIGTVNGGKGQYVDGVLDPSFMVPWWATEHNIDTWWCLDLADQLYGSATVNYRGIADTMQATMLRNGFGWDNSKHIFWQGGTAGTGGTNTPDNMHALDTHSWGAVLLEKWGNASHDPAVSLQRANDLYYVTDVPSGLSGFTTFIPVDGALAGTIETPWYEGSFGVVVAERGNDTDLAASLMETLIAAQRPDGSYLYALQNDPVNDIHAWPCIIAGAWNILAMGGEGDFDRVLWPLP
jgi:phage-related protein